MICLPKHAQVENASLFFQLEHLVTRDKYPAETKQSGSIYISRRINRVMTQIPGESYQRCRCHELLVRSSDCGKLGRG